MAYPPTTLTINTSSGIISVAIPAGGNASDFIQSIVKGGGVTVPQSDGAQPNATTFTPMSQIFGITAS